jgi:hypothetical protein
LGAQLIKAAGDSEEQLRAIDKVVAAELGQPCLEPKAVRETLREIEVKVKRPRNDQLLDVRPP